MVMMRFAVAEDSMRPLLVPGTELVATDSRRPGVGEIVVFPHPERENFWMVKRLATPPEPLDPQWAWVLSDNAEATRADSRSMGPVPLASLMPVVDRFDPVTFVEAVELLAGEDAALAALIGVHGIPDFWQREPGFANLVLFILEQQVSLESGAAVYRRLIEAGGEITPSAIVALDREGIIKSGVTRQKTGYILDLAEAILGGHLDLDSLSAYDPDTARSDLLARRGIGPWTADVYLLSALGHIDMFPVGDRALQVGAGEVLGMRSVPGPAELEILSQRWRPVRAAAARLIWHAYLTSRGRAEPVIQAPYL